MAKQTFRVNGLKELGRALSELPRATEKNVLRRYLKGRGQPIADAAAAAATRRSGDLADSFAVSTKLSPRQKGQHRKMFRNDRASVEMFIGAGPLPQAHLEEFGSVHNDPQPMLRPAWDEGKMTLLDGIGDDLWKGIYKAAARLAKKRAKAGL